ncbi:MAG: urease accessory protein UreE [Acidithiobacillus sp.]
MIIITSRTRSPVAGSDEAINYAMTAEMREKARQQFTLPDGRGIHLQLPRGSVLYPGDVLLTEKGEAIIRVIAEPEAVYTIRANHPLALLRAAYHLGNRHVAMEVTEQYLRIKPDHVLLHLIEQLGSLCITEEHSPFLPDAGAYVHHHH